MFRPSGHLWEILMACECRDGRGPLYRFTSINGDWGALPPTGLKIYTWMERELVRACVYVFAHVTRSGVLDSEKD